MSEETLYSDNSVSVTTTRVVITGTTYALRNITSVKMVKTIPSIGCAVMLLILGGIFLVGSLGMAADSSQRDKAPAIFAFLLGVGIAAAVILWLLKRRHSYHVAIASASGEGHALTSKDKDYIEKIVASINEAIVRYQ